jgi:hypothetical protein
MTEEFSRRVDVQVFKDEPDTREEWMATATIPAAGFLDGDPDMVLDIHYQDYVKQFQPYRWHAVALNNEILCQGERYFNVEDLVSTIQLLFGADTTTYWMAMYGEKRGEYLLRFGKTDRDHQEQP